MGMCWGSWCNQYRERPHSTSASWDYCLVIVESEWRTQHCLLLRCGLIGEQMECPCPVLKFSEDNAAGWLDTNTCGVGGQRGVYWGVSVMGTVGTVPGADPVWMLPKIRTATHCWIISGTTLYVMGSVDIIWWHLLDPCSQFCELFFLH